jgi:hypothetical protein
VQARLGGLTTEQLAAVEALTRGLVNKFLHPPMQALKQAARESDQVKLDAVCEEWSVSVAAEKPASEGGGGFNPRITPAESTPALAAEEFDTQETRR